MSDPITPVADTTLPAKNLPGKPKLKSDRKDAGFRTLLVMMCIGVLGIITISIFACFKNEKHGLSYLWPVLGLSLVISLAAAICGGFLGFLFGIPRSQKKIDHGDVTGERGFGNNTNLEEISDWLTKIIVGVSLTQLPAIERKFHILTVQASAGFNTYLENYFSYTYAACLMVFFGICGFFAVYLWSRIYLFEILNLLERTLADITESVSTQVTEAVDEKLKTAYQSRLWETRKTDFEKQKGRIVAAEATDDIKAIVAVANPGPVTILDDCQQKRWGEQTVADGYEVVAEFNQVPTEPDYFKVTLTVQPAAGAGKELTGKVYFFRHDSFYPEIIVATDAAENKAIHEFVSFEAFTVGIALNAGNNKLEINLNNYPGVPEKYTYPEDEIYSIEKIEKEITDNTVTENK